MTAQEAGIALLAPTSDTTGNTVTTNYTYDALNRLSTVTEANTGTTQYNYDPAGNLASFTEPNGVVHQYTYDPENRLANLAVSGTGGSPVASYACTLDAAGHRKSVTELSGRTVNYAYDNIYRLISETIASDPNSIDGEVQYAYDNVGNRLQQASSLSPVRSGLFSYDPNDRISNDTYDANGIALTTGCNPIYSDILMNSNSGNSHFNAFEASYEIRPGSGLPSVLRTMTLAANYTYSQAILEVAQTGSSGITDVGSSKGSGMSYYNPAQFAFNRGPASYNRSQVFSLSYVQPLPALQNASGLVRGALGGWNWSGIFTAESGDSMTLTAGSDVSKSGLGQDRMNIVNPSAHGTGAQANASPCPASRAFCVPFLNVSNFALPATGQFGNVGAGSITGPGGWNYDMGLMKSFIPLTSHENFRLQVRGDFFNVLNHPWFADPSLSYSSGTTFGRITGQANSERIIQLAAKVFF